MSIRGKLLGLILGISFIPVLVVGYISYSNFKQISERQTRNQLTDFVRHKYEKVKLFLAVVEMRASDFASDGFIRDSLEQLRQNKEDRAIGDAVTEHLLKEKKSLDGRILVIDLMAPDGMVIVSTDPAREGRSQRIPSQLKMHQSTAYISGLWPAGKEGGMAVDVLSGVHARNKPQHLGYLKIRFDVGNYGLLLTGKSPPVSPGTGGDSGMEEPGETYLVNDDGRIINELQQPYNRPFQGVVETEPVKRCLIQDENMTGYWLNYHNVPVVGASRCMDMGDFKWVLVSEMLRSDAAALHARYRDFFGTVLLIVLGLIAVMTVFASRAFDRMIGAFRNSRREIEDMNQHLRSANNELKFNREAMDDHAIIVETDVSGVITRVNRKFCEISQYSEEELLGRTHRVINSGQHSGEFFQDMWSTISSGSVWHGDICNRRKDGGLYWVRTTIVPHKDDHGRVDRYIALRTDVSYQKQVEQKLVRSNRSLLARARIQMTIMNAEEEQQLLDNVCSVLVNEGGYRFAWMGYAQQDESKRVLPMASAGHEDGYLDEIKLGWGEDEHGCGPAGRTIRSGQETIVCEAETDSDFALWRTAALERGYQSIIVLPLHQQNETFGVIAIYSAETDVFDAEEVKLPRMLADDVAHGIYALRFRLAHEAIEASLRESEINLRRAQAMAHLGSWELDLATDKMIWSDELYRILGYEPGTIIPSLSLLLESVSSDQRRTVEQRLYSSIKDGEVRSQEFSILHSDGGLRHVVSRLVAYSDGEQCITRIAGTLMDVTEQKRSESERQSLQSQLQHAQKLEAIGQLTGGVAHDFNNILSSIMGYTTLAMEECPVDDSEYLGYLEEVSKAGVRAKELIGQLMTFSRRDTRTVEIIDPNTLVQDVFNMLKPALPAAIKFEFESEPDMPSVRADEVQLHQVVTNLIINGRDAIDKYGKVTLRMRRKELHHCLCTSCQQRFSGDYIEICVSDDGKGIANENMIAMFEPFFTTKEKGKGTGMGLSMVHGLVHSHGGHICVKSVIGQGSTFSIYLPVYRGEAAPASKDKTAVKALSGRTDRINGDATILLVDDEAAVTRVMSDILTQQGYRCVQSHSPAEALKHYSEEPENYDLVITDQVMQQMDGMEMVRHMQAQRDGLPVILCSGYTSELKEADIARADFCGVIKKPIDAGELVDLVAESLVARSGAG